VQIPLISVDVDLLQCSKGMLIWGDVIEVMRRS